MVCNRIFQGTAKNRGTLTIGELVKPMEVCDYHREAIEQEVDLLRKIMEAQGKP